LQLLQGDPALSRDTVVDQEHGHAPVVQIVQPVVGIDVGQLRLVAEGPEEGQSLVAEMTALAGHQDKPHRLEGWLARQA